MAMRRTSTLKRRRSFNNIGILLIAGFLLSLFTIFFNGKAKTDLQATVVNNTPVVVGQFDTVEVIVPTEPISAGTLLKDVRFRKVSFPVHQVPKGAIHDISPYLSSVAVVPLPANLPVFTKNLSGMTSATNPVIERIPEGMRAMTVRVDATSSVEGWASSGAIVDVLLVTGEGTSVVAEKVKILSAERSVNPLSNLTNPTVPSTVTLLVSQKQCLAINTATPMGKIAFALRSLGDNGDWSDKRFNRDSIRAGIAPEKIDRVEGYVRIEGQNPKTFALSNNKWIPTDTDTSTTINREKSS